MPSRISCFRLVPFPATALHALLAGWLAVGALASGPDFRREVLPILSDKCFHCHGPSETGRKAGLRLDTREGAVAVKGGGVQGRGAGEAACGGGKLRAAVVLEEELVVPGSLLVWGIADAPVVAAIPETVPEDLASIGRKKDGGEPRVVYGAG